MDVESSIKITEKVSCLLEILTIQNLKKMFYIVNGDPKSVVLIGFHPNGLDHKIISSHYPSCLHTVPGTKRSRSVRSWRLPGRVRARRCTSRHGCRLCPTPHTWMLCRRRHLLVGLECIIRRYSLLFYFFKEDCFTDCIVVCVSAWRRPLLRRRYTSVR